MNVWNINNPYISMTKFIYIQEKYNKNFFIFVIFCTNWIKYLTRFTVHSNDLLFNHLPFSIVNFIVNVGVLPCII